MTQQRAVVDVEWSARDNRPVRFSFQHRFVSVSEVVDQWPGVDYDYFKVRGDDGVLYILLHTPANHWELVLTDPGTLSPPDSR